MNRKLNLPWFNINNYRKAREFTLFDWYFQLNRRIGFRTFDRKFVMAFFDEGTFRGRDIPKSIIDNFEGRLATTWNKIEENPILDIPDIEFTKIKNHPIINTPHLVKMLAVKQATIDDLPHEIDNKDYHLIKEYINLLSNNADKTKNIAEPSWKKESSKAKRLRKTKEIRQASDDRGTTYFLGEQPLLHNNYSENLSLISVDFNAPEKLILEQFSKLVKEKKKTTNANIVGSEKNHTLDLLPNRHKYTNYKEKTDKTINKKPLFNEDNQRKWAAYQLLPCIDLWIYGQLNNITFSLDDLDCLLFPKSHNINPDPDRIKTTILPPANKLFTPKTIFAMEFELSKRSE